MIKLTRPDQTQSISLLRILLIFAIVTSFIDGPTFGIGPADVAIFDIVFLLLVPTSIISFSKNPTFHIPRLRSLFVVSGLYFGFEVFLPVVGVVVYEYPIGYIVGDIRWLQILFVGFIIVNVYGRSISTLVGDIESAFKMILISHLVVFLLQLVNYLGVIDTSSILELWYLNRPRYGDYGYHIGRFAGAASTSSGLGLSAALAIAMFSRSVLESRDNALFLMLAVFLLLASGNRTSMVAVGGIAILFAVYVLVLQGLSRRGLRHSAVLSILSLPLFLIIYYFNIGRVATSDRYNELIAIFFGRATWAEVSGRVDRWEPALERAEEYSIGTLSNAAHVFNDLEAIDSYFVLTYLQGGILFLASFLLVLSVVVIISTKFLKSQNYALLPLSLVGITISFSLTANYATSLSGKLVIVLAVIITIVLSYSER